MDSLGTSVISTILAISYTTCNSLDTYGETTRNRLLYSLTAFTIGTCGFVCRDFYNKWGAIELTPLENREKGNKDMGVELQNIDLENPKDDE